MKTDKTIEAAISEAAKEIYSIVPDNFNDAFFRMEIIDDVWVSGLFYSIEVTQYQYKNNGLDEIKNQVRNIRSFLIENKEKPFSTITIAFKGSGKFYFDFGYEDISDFGQASERRKKWIKKYLGEKISISWE